MSDSFCRTACALTVAVAMAATACPATCREPLIDFQTGQTLVSNLKARQVGDLITIIITETATAKASSKTKADNKSETIGVFCQFSVKIVLIKPAVGKNVHMNHIEMITPGEVVGVVFHSGCHHNAVISVGESVGKLI